MLLGGFTVAFISARRSTNRQLKVVVALKISFANPYHMQSAGRPLLSVSCGVAS
jgi:hypothetical protein